MSQNGDTRQTIVEKSDRKAGQNSEQTGNNVAPWTGWSRWVVAVAAGFLLFCSLGGYFYHRNQLADIAADHVRLRVSGPARLQAGSENRFSVVTTSITGRPVSAQIEFALRGLGGTQLHSHVEKTDGNGHLQLTLPTHLDISEQAELELVAVHRDGREVIETAFGVEPIRFVTQLWIDSRSCRPGDTVRFRSLTLSKFELKVAKDARVHFVARDLYGAAMVGSQYDCTTQRGVASGEFVVPTDSPAGQYVLVSESGEELFREVRQPFFVQPDPPAQLTKDLEFTRHNYGSGDTVLADLAVKNQNGSAVAGARIHVLAAVDGKKVYDHEASLTDTGTARIEFKLPEDIEEADGHSLVITVDDSESVESMARKIPIELHGVDAKFYPESGKLVAGLVNTVYFTARDARQRPLELAGRVVNSFGQIVAIVETIHPGIGSFSIRPRGGEQYRLEIKKPDNVDKAPRLPPAYASRSVVISARPAVFEAGGKLAFVVRSSEIGLPLVGAIWCRGVLLGHEAFVTNEGANQVAIDLNSSVGGIFRLSVYDYRTSPPELVAERLAYRKSAERLIVQTATNKSRYWPGDRAKVPFQVRDQHGQPATATIAASVVERGVSELRGNQETTVVGRVSRPVYHVTGLETRPTNATTIHREVDSDSDRSRQADLQTGWRPFPFGRPPFAGTAGLDIGDAYMTGALLADEFQILRRLEDTDGDLSKDAELNATIDLLLGTHGWRQSARRPGQVDQATEKNKPVAQSASRFGTTPPPAVFDNLTVLRRRYRERLEDYHASKTRVNTVTTLSLFGAAGLLLLVTMLAILNIARGPRVWIPTLMAATACLVVGVDLMGPGRPKLGEDGLGAFAPFQLTIGQEDRDKATQGATVAEGQQPDGADEVAVATESATPWFDKHWNQTESPKTVFWDPVLVTDKDGCCEIDFALPDSASKLGVTLDVNTNDGRIGSSDSEIVSKPPFILKPKLPSEVTAGDHVDLPLEVTSDTDARFSVEVQVKVGELLQLSGKPGRTVQLDPGETIVEFFALDALKHSGHCSVEFLGTVERCSDSVSSPVRVVQEGFPRELSVSGCLEGEQQVILPLPDQLVPQSLQASLYVFPSILAELETGSDYLLSLPQTPLEEIAVGHLSALALQYIEQHSGIDPEITRRVKQRLENAHTKFASRQLPSGGFPWFHDDSGHLPLTAYSLWAFREMSKVFEIRSGFLKPTQAWVLSKHDGGRDLGTVTNHVFGAARPDLANAYVTWFLSLAEQAEKANQTTDMLSVLDDNAEPAVLALGALSAMNVGKEAEGLELLERLSKSQAEDGHLAMSGITGDVQLAAIEATALAAMAWMRSSEFSTQAEDAIDWLVTNRRANGGFGSTPATVLALAALTEHAARNPRPVSGGDLVIKRDDDVLATRAVSAGDSALVSVEGIEKDLTPGENHLAITLTGDSRLPYSLAVTFRTRNPENDDSCPVQLAVALDKTTATRGEPVSLNVELVNTSDQPQAGTVAVLGLPAGLEARAKQLEELLRSETMDYCEARGREIICHWDGLDPNQRVAFQIDLVASVPGRYTGPPSCVFLCAASDMKQWAAPLKIAIERKTAE